MKKSFIKTLTLLGAFIILLVWFLVYEEKMRLKNEEKEEKTKRIAKIERNDIKFATFHLPEKKLEDKTPNPIEGAEKGKKKEAAPLTEVKLKKLGEDWQIISPVEYPAEKSIISAMLNTITSTNQQRVVQEKATDLKVYGLEPPRLKATVKTKEDGPGITIHIGNKTPVGSNLYVTNGAEPNKVLLIDTSLFRSLNKTPNDLRKKKILKVAIFEVTEMEIKNKAGSFVVQREKDGNDWTLARTGLPVDISKWNRTLTAVVDLKATNFLDNEKDPSKFGLSPSRAVRIDIKKKDQPEKITLFAGKKGDKYYAKIADKPHIFEIKKSAFEKYEKNPKEYRHLALMKFNRFDVSRIQVETKTSPTLELEKTEDNNWKLTKAKDKEVDKAKVEDLLTTLQDLKIDDYLLGKNEVKTEKPHLVIRLFKKNKKESADSKGKKESEEAAEVENLVVTLTDPKGKFHWGTRTGLTTPFKVSRETVGKLKLAETDYLKPEKKKEPKEDKAKKDKASKTKETS